MESFLLTSGTDYTERRLPEWTNQKPCQARERERMIQAYLPAAKIQP